MLWITLGLSRYLLIYDLHITSVESRLNSFKDFIFFKINVCSCGGEVLINLNDLDAWYNGINITTYTTSCADIC